MSKKLSNNQRDELKELFAARDTTTREEALDYAREEDYTTGVSDEDIISIFEEYAEETGVFEDLEYNEYYNDGVRDALEVLKKCSSGQFEYGKVEALLRKEGESEDKVFTGH